MAAPQAAPTMSILGTVAPVAIRASSWLPSAPIWKAMKWVSSDSHTHESTCTTPQATGRDTVEPMMNCSPTGSGRISLTATK